MDVAFATGSTRRAPILVTGMPRSGTTWTARLLATAEHTALTGREPMNPRGRQYALAGTLPGWASLDVLSARQRWALRTCFWGVNPFVYSRYGRRQWAAAWPGTRTIIKDPFAMLSMPVVAAATGARVVLIYRHPGAALASYRRMGWEPDLEELQGVIDERNSRAGLPDRLEDLPRPGEVSDPEAMARFWNALYAMALQDVDRVPGVVLVSHQELAAGGAPFARALFDTLGLTWTAAGSAELTSETSDTSGQKAEPEGAERDEQDEQDEDAQPQAQPSTTDPRSPRSTVLHDFDRRPSEVATSWRSRLGAGEEEVLEALTGQVQEELARRRFVTG